MFETEQTTKPEPSKMKHTYIKNLRWYIAGLLLFATTINYLDRQTLSVAAPVLRDLFKMSNTDYSHIVQAFLLAYMVMMPISGRIIDWMGTRWGFCLSVVWWSIANILTAFAGSVGGFSVCRFLLGVGEAGNFPASIKTISEWFPSRERALATGIFNMGAGFGAIIAPPLIGVLIIYYGWQAGFIVTGLVGFIWVIAWLLLFQAPEKHPRLSPAEFAYIRDVRPDDSATDNSDSGKKKAMLLDMRLWGCIIAKFLTDPVWWFYIFWLPDYLKNVRHFSLAKIAMFAWLPFLAADFGSVFGGAISTFFIRRGWPTLKARKLAMCVCASLMPVALLAVRAQSAAVAIVYICVATLGHQAWSASLLTLPADLFPRKQVGTAFGFSGAAGSLGGFVFAGLTGIILDRIGYVPIFTAIGFMHPIAAIIIVLMIKDRAQKSTVCCI
ncbi:MAG: MFS transporter [Phycisphaerae bacterium]|jgi:ACS family hexuronate transporter-like MFS transporter